MVGALPPDPAAQAPQEAIEEESPKGRVTNKDLEARIDGMENMLAALMTSMGIPIPEQPTMLEEAPVEEPPPAAAEQAAGGDFSLLAPPDTDMPLGAQSTADIPGLPMAEVGGPTPGIPKTAANLGVVNSRMDELMAVLSQYQ
jgi:hypothetical protein